MTLCAGGIHPFPEEDDEGAYCQEHGVMLIRTDHDAPDRSHRRDAASTPITPAGGGRSPQTGG